MSKKYLSLEEAAAELGMSPGELNRLRERNEIRAFADRGDWKFKEEDVDRLRRSRQADSDPDVPLRGSKVDSNEDTGELILDDDDEALDSAPTIIRKTGGEDSDSDVQLIFDDSMRVVDEDSDNILSESDSDVRLSEQPAQAKGQKPSDSDVKLSSPSKDDSDVRLMASDSSVKLVSRSGMLKKPGSDSDVKLSDKAAADSDVKVSRPRPTDSDSERNTLGGTDSDIRLVGDSDSDSDVKLTGLGGTDSDIRLVESPSKSGKRPPSSTGSSGFLKPPSKQGSGFGGPGSGLLKPKSSPKAQDSGISLSPQSSGLGSNFNLNPVSGGSVLDEDSGIALNQGSGILMAGESGINLGKPNDSGISLDDDSGLKSASSMSGISLDGDSGITLDAGSSGISLDPGSSGISLEAGDSGISLEDIESHVVKKGGSSKIGGRRQPATPRDLKQTDGDIDITAPMPAYSGDDDIIDTQMEVPLLGDDSHDDIKLANTSDGMTFSDSSADGTNIITLADEGDVDEYAGTMVKKGRGHDDDDEVDSETFETEAVEEDDFAIEEDAPEVSDEIVGEDDELEEIDVFGSQDDDFAEPEVDELSEDELPTPKARGIAAPVEHEWGGLTFSFTLVATILMLLCGSVTFDLVRNTWRAESTTPVTSVLLDNLRGLFK